MKLTIDLNCDMGESLGLWTMGQDADILPYVTSANIACGFHAGDPSTMRRTVQAAIKHDVALGAHPGLPDLVGFGRRAMAISPDDAYDLVVVQVGALAAVASSQGGHLHHVKAHGALYNLAVNNTELAKAVAQAVFDVNPQLILYALASSLQIDIARNLGLQVAQEVFCDRSYQSDGSLTPRSQPNAMITDPDLAVQQILTMLQHGKIISQQGTEVQVQADTLCIHGDQPNAVLFASRIRHALQQQGVAVKPFGGVA